MLGLEGHQQSHVTLLGRPHKAFLCVVLKVIWFPLPGKEYSLPCLVFFTRACGLAHVALVGFLLFFTNGCRIVTCPPRLSWQTGHEFPLLPRFPAGLYIAQETSLVSHTPREFYK